MKRIAIIIDGKVSEIRNVEDKAAIAPNVLEVVTDPLPVFASATHKVEHGTAEIVEGDTPHVRETWRVVPLSTEEMAEMAEVAKDIEDRQAIKGAVAALEAGTATGAQVQRALAKVIRWIIRRWSNT